jgi:hypothetical protein
LPSPPAPPDFSHPAAPPPTPLRHAALLFFLWALWLSAPYWVLGPDSYIRLHNNGDANLPAMLALPRNLAQGQFGLWAPQWAAGVDRLAQGTTNSLLTLLFLLLPGWAAYAAIMLLQRFLAGYFTWRLLRDDLGTGPASALFAGLSYALFCQAALNHSWAGFTLYDGLGVPAFPLVLWLLSRLGEKPSLPSALLAVVAGTLFGLTSPLVTALFLAPLILFWFVVVSPRRTPGSWVGIALFAAAWALGTLPSVLPGLAVVPQSQRADVAFAQVWGLRSHIYTAALEVRDNLLPILLALAGLVAARFRAHRLLWLVLAAAFCGLMEIVYGPLAHVLARYARIFAEFQMERFNLLVPLLTLAAAALALDHFRQASAKTGRALALAAIALVVLQSLWVLVRIRREMHQGRTFATYYRNPELERLARQNAGAPPFRVATIAVGDVLPLFPPGAAWAYGLETADGFLNLHSRRYKDFWEQVIAPELRQDPARANFVRHWGAQLYLFTPGNSCPSGPVPFREYYDLDLLSLANVRYLISPVPVSDERLKLLSAPATDAPSTPAMIGGPASVPCPRRGLYVYENGGVLPRFFLANKVRVFDDREQFLAALAVAGREELSSTVFVDAASARALPLARLGSQTGSVRLLRYSADRIELEVEAASPSVLMVADSYSPYWHAWLDGAETRLFPADHAFQGVLVETGRHAVVLRYRPEYAP